MTQYTVNVNWDRIHIAAKAVNHGGSNLCQSFGLAYNPSYYQDRGVAGLSLLASEANRYRHMVWKAIHGASSAYRSARELIPAQRPRAYRERRQAYSRHVSARANACERARGVITDARLNVSNAMALDGLFIALAETGIVTYRPNQEICGVTSDDRLNVCGLYWLAGRTTEPERPIPYGYALAFVDHGLDALHACVWTGG